MAEKLRYPKFIEYQVYATYRALARNLDIVLSPFSLTAGQWNALNQLEENGAMTQKALAELLRKKQTTVARLLDRLVKRGLIKRTPCPHDRRANIIENTPEASKLLKEIEPYVLAQANVTAQGVPEENLESFFEVLEIIRENANAASTSAQP